MKDQDSNIAKPNICPNCQVPLINKAEYCHNCGQKNTSGRLTVKEFFHQFFDNVFNLDSKIFRTLGAVLIPGKLTIAFLNGQRRKYYHPIRLFLVLLIIALACYTYHGNISIPSNLRKEHIDKLKERKRLMDVLDDSINTLSEKTDQHSVVETLDTLSNVFYKNSGNRYDSININEAMKITDGFDFYIAIDDFGKYSSEEMLEVYKVKGFLKRLRVKQKIKMLEDGTSFISFLMGKITWAVFIVLLLLTLIFKLLYFKTDFLYLEHLIFGIHLNAFFFILLSIVTILPEDIMEKLIPWTLIIMSVYFFIALKRVYNQSYLITSLKFILFLFSYFFLFIFGVILTMIGSFLLF